jgi:hypothetical protein
MRLTVKNYKRVEWMSEETDCYKASLYLDGKRIGTAENEGRGGCDLLSFNSRDDRERFEAACAEWIESVKDDPDAWATDEGFVAEAVTRFRREKDMKKRLKGYATVIRIERSAGWSTEIREIAFPAGYDIAGVLEGKIEPGDKVFAYDAEDGLRVWEGASA